MKESELLEQLEHELELLESGIINGFRRSCLMNVANAKIIIYLLKSEIK